MNIAIVDDIPTDRDLLSAMIKMPFIKTGYRIAATVKKENGQLRSTKHAGFGMGIKSAQTIVKHYNGVIQFQAENDIFCVSGTLNLHK